MAVTIYPSELETNDYTDLAALLLSILYRNEVGNGRKEPGRTLSAVPQKAVQK